MVSAGCSLFTISDRPPFSREGSEDGPVIVWAWGEYDLATDNELSATLARAIALDSAALVVDLSEVEFLGASTLGVIVRARNFLCLRSRSLTVRLPSVFVRRVIDACNLNDLTHADPKNTWSATVPRAG
jgi:anti-anti-sigma factor